SGRRHARLWRRGPDARPTTPWHPRERHATCRSPGWRTPAPGRSPSRGSRRRQGRGPAGRSFWDEALAEVDRGTAQDLVLLLEQPVALAELSHLCFLGQGQAVSHTVLDLGPLDPAVQAGLRDP